ncbi:Flp pilus assembly complex ATPase component TadA [Patescibacteria group bacterium]|nr:Flp pilus assembly complex ATPase component TadA [Patescibacteria group bacterium]
MVAATKTRKTYKKLGKTLEKENILPRPAFKNVLKQAKKEGRFLSEVLLEHHSIPQDQALELLSKHFEVPTVRLEKRIIVPKVLNLIPKDLAQQHSIVVFKKNRNAINVATTAPEDHQTIEFIRKQTGFEPEVHITTKTDIALVLKKYRGEISEEFEKIVQNGTKEALDNQKNGEKMALDLPIINMVNSILEKAINSDASDIHIEPNHNKVTVRFRLDGLLHKMVVLPKSVHPAIVARIKLLSKLKIDEHRSPQDGRFQYNFGNNDCAMRVSVIPTLYGSKVAIRLLDMEQKVFTLQKLGFNKKDFKLLKNEIKSSQGIILVTGPTGSGKTTTLYSTLRMLNKVNTNICTIEDPIEYGIDGVNQTQINPSANLTFVTGLKTILRQDPNILMVGEIRDKDTAKISVNAAMTGHLVLSTLHTNNAFVAPQRLIEMGVQPYLVASVTNMIIAQRLVRKLCRHCRIKVRSNEKIIDDFKDDFNIKNTHARLKKLGLLPKTSKLSNTSLYKSRGCAKCNKTGYAGRIGIYEVLKIDAKLRKIINKDASEAAIKKVALNDSVLTMAEDGLLKVFLGRTTLDEILRVTKE